MLNNKKMYLSGGCINYNLSLALSEKIPFFSFFLFLKKTWPRFMDVVQLPQDYTATTRRQKTNFRFQIHELWLNYI